MAPDGSEFISHGQPEKDSELQNLKALANLPQSEFVEFKPYLLLKEQIIFDEELLGSAVVGLDTRERERLIRESVMFTVIVNVILATLGIGVIVWVTRP